MPVCPAAMITGPMARAMVVSVLEKFTVTGVAMALGRYT